MRTSWSSVVATLAVCLLALSVSALEAQDTEKRWELHVKLGSQTYLNDLDPDPGSASLGGLHIGYNLSNRSMVGLHSASAGYEIQYFDGTTDEEYVNSLLLTYRYSFRVATPLRPYLEAGLGTADPIIGFDDGRKGAFTFALGLKWFFRDKWSVFVESRGVSRSQDDTADIVELLLGARGGDVTVSSNEFTIGVSRLF